MLLSNKRLTKVLIRLRGCAGWSAPFGSQTAEDRFSHVAAHIREVIIFISISLTLCVPIEIPIKFDTVKSGWSIAYVEGSQVINSKEYHSSGSLLSANLYPFY